jgi:hypothetical protein
MSGNPRLNSVHVKASGNSISSLKHVILVLLRWPVVAKVFMPVKALLDKDDKKIKNTFLKEKYALHY